MSEHILFLTGRLAKPRLESVLAGMEKPGFDWRVHDIGVKVAALMTEEIIARRLPSPVEADRVMLPGRCRADLASLTRKFNVLFERGPDELKDIPKHFGREAKKTDMSRYDLDMFAEIVDASQMTVDQIVARAEEYVESGADVVDLGCLPDTPFPHLEDAIRALKNVRIRVSVDSANADELLRGGKAGADFLLSLSEETLWIADEVSSVPVLIPASHGDLDSLYRAMDMLDAKGKRYIVDPVLDPIHFGFMTSLVRYQAVRQQRPDCEMLMGTGNLTELTDADSGGVTAMLLGICSELGIRNVLVVQVSPHTIRTVEEHDYARRLMYAAKRDSDLPKNYGDGLLGLHDRDPFPNTPEEIAGLASELRDKNFRIETAADGIHIYSSAGHHVAQDAFELFPKLGVEDDGAHAFYLGAELAKAEIAWRLGKRFAQDEPLDWGVAVEMPEEDRTRLKEAGHTLVSKKQKAE